MRIFANLVLLVGVLAKKSVFVPAEKDRKPVSVYEILEYSFTTTMGGVAF